MKFKSKLESIRKQLGFSNYKVAKDLNLDWHTLDKLEQGLTERISVDTMKLVKNYYKQYDPNFTLDDIFIFDDVIDFDSKKKIMKAS